MGSASRLLGGNQAKRANFFKVSSSGSHVPQSAKPGSFSPSFEPASFTGVVAGTKGCLTRRWIGRSLLGRMEDPDFQVSGCPGRFPGSLVKPPKVSGQGGPAEAEGMITVSEFWIVRVVPQRLIGCTRSRRQ